MKNYWAFTVIFVGVLVIAAPVLADPPERQSATVSTPGTERTLVLPAPADNAGVISLGTGIDPQTGKVVEGIAIIHPKKEFHHRPGHSGGPGGGGTSKCYSFLAQGAKWKTVESWVVNPANTEGLSNSFVFDNLTADIAKWESASGADILGNGSTTGDALTADTASPDAANEVYFADIDDSNAIAVTIVWGIFSGPPFGRELVEWDQVFDDATFDWSSSGESGKMDFENIATHELGHSAGMGHPDDSCTQETMYRFADFGETIKRTLNAGDIAGIGALY